MTEFVERPYRRLLPIWLWAYLVVLAGLLGWVRLAFDPGDTGLVNVLTMLVIILASIPILLWYLFFSRFTRKTRFTSLGVGILALVGLSFLFQWDGFSGAMVPQFRFRFMTPEEPGSAGVGVAAVGIDLVTTTPYDFPGFLGADRSMTVPGVKLARDWDASPPELVWRQPIGAGWSAFAVVNGYAITMEQRGDQELITAYDLRTGDLQWSHARPVRFTHPLGGPGPRSTPLIDEGRVYALSAVGVLTCLDGATGEMIWEVDLLEEYGVTPEQEFRNVGYGRSNSPLVVDDLVIIPAGGNPDRPPVSLVAFDKNTGEKVWEGGNRQISFSSPRLATVAGVEQILILNEDTASGHDPATGAMLWEHPWPGSSAAEATSSQAIPVPPDRVFLSKGYGEGSAVVRLVPGDDGTFEAKEVWHNRAALRTKFTNVVLAHGHAFGLSQGILECVSLATGERAWKRGRYGQGQILLVGKTLLILTEDGEVVMIEPTPDIPNLVLGRFQALEGITWNNLALYAPYLVIRNAQEAAVYRLPLAG